MFKLEGEGERIMETVEMLYIPPKGRLDGITVYFHNYEMGRGMVTVVCYGCAWNAYFNGLLHRSIQEFFAEADVYYLADKMICTQWFKDVKRLHRYLMTILTAVQNALKESK